MAWVGAGLVVIYRDNRRRQAGLTGTGLAVRPMAAVAQSRSSGTIQNGFWPRSTRSKLSKALRQRFQ